MRLCVVQYFQIALHLHAGFRPVFWLGYTDQPVADLLLDQQLQQRMARGKRFFQSVVPRSHPFAVSQFPLQALLRLHPFEFGQSSFVIFAEGLCFLGQVGPIHIEKNK